MPCNNVDLNVCFYSIIKQIESNSWIYHVIGYESINKNNKISSRPIRALSEKPIIEGINPIGRWRIPEAYDPYLFYHLPSTRSVEGQQ
jgi:hypothetical protein